MKTSPLRFTIACTILLIGALLAGATWSSSGTSISKGSLAPPFRLVDASGSTVHLSDYRGKVVLLDFWATECGGCRLEIPWYMEFERAYKDKGLTVVGVSMDVWYENLKDAEEGWNRVRPFVQTQKVNYPILMGDNQVTRAYNIHSLPATYLIDGNGRIAVSYVGVLADKSALEANIKHLLMER
jgi:peroxiredoxin